MTEAFSQGRTPKPRTARYPTQGLVVGSNKNYLPASRQGVVLVQSTCPKSHACKGTRRTNNACDEVTVKAEYLLRALVRNKILVRFLQDATSISESVGSESTAQRLVEAINRCMVRLSGIGDQGSPTTHKH